MLFKVFLSNFLTNLTKIWEINKSPLKFHQHLNSFFVLWRNIAQCLGCLLVYLPCWGGLSLSPACTHCVTSVKRTSSFPVPTFFSGKNGSLQLIMMERVSIMTRVSLVILHHTCTVSTPSLIRGA